MLIPMSQATSQNRVFLRISNGTVNRKKADGSIEVLGGVSGALKKIEMKENEFDGKKFKNWHVVLTDALQGEIYDLAVPYASGAFKGIVRCLVTQIGLENLDDVKIEAYMSKSGYTNTIVYAGGQKLGWIDEEMPKMRYVQVGDQQVADNTAQMNWIQTLVDRINAKLEERNAAKPADAPAAGEPVKKAEGDDDFPF